MQPVVRANKRLNTALWRNVYGHMQVCFREMSRLLSVDYKSTEYEIFRDDKWLVCSGSEDDRLIDSIGEVEGKHVKWTIAKGRTFYWDVFAASDNGMKMLEFLISVESFPDSKIFSKTFSPICCQLVNAGYFDVFVGEGGHYGIYNNIIQDVEYYAHKSGMVYRVSPNVQTDLPNPLLISHKDIKYSI